MVLTEPRDTQFEDDVSGTASQLLRCSLGLAGRHGGEGRVAQWLGG